MGTLSAGPVAAHAQLVGDDDAVPFEFPELPLRAQRILKPYVPLDQMSTAEREWYEVEVLLRRHLGHVHLVEDNDLRLAREPRGEELQLRIDGLQVPHRVGTRACTYRTAERV